MKWIDKGHQFDEVWERLSGKEAFYLFGSGMYGTAMCEEMEKLGVRVIGFIDNNKQKQNTAYMGKSVYGLNEVCLKEHEAIVVCVSPFTRKPIMAQLNMAGYTENNDIFTMEIFMSLKYVYDLHKMYIPSVSFLPSTGCNLNCEACLNFTPYIKHPMVRTFEQVKADMDLFFNVIDRIMLFHISGGEPFLYPYLKELIIYIGENYRDKIHFLQTVTNGTIEMREDVLEVLAKYQVGVTVDDYRLAVPEKADVFAAVVEKLEKYHIRHDINKVDRWIDLAPMSTDHSGWDEYRLTKHFEACHEPWQELRGGRLYSCNYASYAAVAGLTGEYEEETFDLTSYNRDRMKELMEFRLGYNEKGYVDFCRRCAGFIDINPNIVEPAIQKS